MLEERHAAEKAEDDEHADGGRGADLEYAIEAQEKELEALVIAHEKEPAVLLHDILEAAWVDKVVARHLARRTTNTHPEVRVLLENMQDVFHVLHALALSAIHRLTPHEAPPGTGDLEEEEQARQPLMRAIRDYLWTLHHSKEEAPPPLTKQEEAQILMNKVRGTFAMLPEKTTPELLSMYVMLCMDSWVDAYEEFSRRFPGLTPPLLAMIFRKGVLPSEEKRKKAMKRIEKAIAKAPGGPQGDEAIRQALCIATTTFGVPTKDAHNTFRP